MITPQPFACLQAMEARCREVATGLPRPAGTRQWAGIGFRLGLGWYAVPLDEVSEILREPGYAPLPGVKPWVCGLANRRGRLLPVLDLGAYLGIAARPSGQPRRLLVVDSPALFAGLRVDEISGLQHFALESFAEQVPDCAPAVRPLLYGAFRRERFWPVFSLRRLVEQPDFLQPDRGH